MEFSAVVWDDFLLDCDINLEYVSKLTQTSLISSINLKGLPGRPPLWCANMVLLGRSKVYEEVKASS